jgi:hypothetical protein
MEEFIRETVDGFVFFGLLAGAAAAALLLLSPFLFAVFEALLWVFIGIPYLVIRLFRGMFRPSPD